VQSRVQQFRE